MLLKSASTPLVQTILSSSFHKNTPKRDPLAFDPDSSRVSSYSRNNGDSSAPSPNSRSTSRSPKFSDGKSIKPRLNSFRRAFSDSSLGDLLASSSSCSITLSPRSPRFQRKLRNTMLETAPSFSIYDDGTENPVASMERTVTIGDAIEATTAFDFSFADPNMELIKEEEEEEEGEQDWKDCGGGPPSPPMYLAAGLGVDDGGSIVANFLESEKVEAYYRDLVEDYPTHPLILRNYAQLLKGKGDYQGAEEYYSRAAVTDNADGEILSQYAKLVWDLHGDQEKASAYFERAAEAAPQDSHVMAAYASFLWETDKDGDNQADGLRAHREDMEMGTGIAGLGGSNDRPDLGTGGPNESANIEEYYRKMVEKDPSNPLFLRNYAHFLYKTKGDLRGAEEYYSRAILADPQDGEILSNYAVLVWESYQDSSKASGYFERAVQAAPDDSTVLAAYASFLWSIGEEEEAEAEAEATVSSTIRVPVLPTMASASA